MMTLSRIEPMSEHKHKPFVPETVEMTEFTLRAFLVGLVMTLVLGAANAYLGLRAGITIAATYPAAVIGMAVLRFWKASILEENVARTAGSIGESVAAGAIFTLPAFVISRAWPSFGFEQAYWKSTVLMVTGGILGVLFCSLVQRVMVEDRELPFPESVAASEIHKAGRRGAEAARFLFYNVLVGGAVYLLGAFRVFLAEKEFHIHIGTLGQSIVRLGPIGSTRTLPVGGLTTFAGPSISPAYLGVGYIIGPKLAALNFSGGVLAWGLLVPLLIYFLGPDLQKLLPPGQEDQGWVALADSVWRYIVRPIAVGGMLVGAAFTLFRMRKNLAIGLGRAFAEFRGHSAAPSTARTERYLSSRTVILLMLVMFVAMLAIYYHFSSDVTGTIVAGTVMLIAGFFFATVSGSLVGLIGSSNNPISGLTLSTLILAALLMVSLGVSGLTGVATVLGVAAVVCVSAAVAGEMLKDFKVSWILGGTPRTIQIVELIAVVCAGLVMYFPLLILHEGNIKAGGTGFGDRALAAPQAGLMASLSQGIVGGEMAWPLVVVGVFMGITMIMLQVRSPMLVAVGMYLPVATTFAIFIGGIIRWVTDTMASKRGLNDAQKVRVENAGILTASGLIAGEALMGLAIAAMFFFEIPVPRVFESPSYLIGVLMLALLGVLMVRAPLANAGRPDEPAPPAAMM